MEYRYPLEIQVSPFTIALNPSEVHDHSSVYIYRILPLPIDMVLTFQAVGLSYVEVYDADNDRFLLAEKTEINEDKTFVIDWDGAGVFEPRIWKDGNVTGMTLHFSLPQEQIIPEIKPKFDSAPWISAAGITIGVLGAVIIPTIKGRHRNV